MTEEGEADRIEEDNIHLSGLELFHNSHDCILWTIVLEPQAQNQVLEPNPKSDNSEALHKGTKKWKRIARQMQYSPRLLKQPRKCQSQDGGTEQESKPRRKIQGPKNEGMIPDSYSKATVVVY